MHPRGRSRDVSPVALARQASEERRRNRSSIMSCYPLPNDPENHTLGHLYFSSPSPSSSPATTSFALTPPDPAPLCARPRPRVAQDSSHAPIDPREPPFTTQVINPQPLRYPVQSQLSPPLLPSPLVGKPALQDESVQRAHEQAQAKRRYETLARAEQIFATILERSRRERLAALLLRAQQEDELVERQRVTREFERLEHERDRRRSLNYLSHTHRTGFRVLARVTPPNPTSQQRQVPDRFTYTFPVPSTSLANLAPIRQQQGGMKTRLSLAVLTSPNSANTCSISFDDIRESMGNVLFPMFHGESASGKTRRESELLGTLLDPVRREEGERWHLRGRVNVWTSRLPEAVPGCEACASTSLSLDGFSAPFPQTPSFSSGASTSTSISVASRPISWLSFGSRKLTSSSINPAPAQTTPLSMTNYLPSTSGHPIPQHSCGCTRGQSFVAVDVNDSPLGTGAELFPTPVLSAANVDTYQDSAHHRALKPSFSARTWLAMQSSVTSVLSMATRLQHVYVTATVATPTATHYTQDVPTFAQSSSKTSSGYARCLPSGWRARRSDVAKFTSTASHADRDAVPYIVFHLVELEGTHLFSSPTPTPSLDPLASQDHISPPPTPPSVTIPPTYYDADRHIFNANPLHLLSRAQINSWRFRGAPGAMPAQVFYRPELFYRLEPAGRSLREAKGGSALKWGWRVVWDIDDHVEF
ncbi:hypothetical protein BJV74DRAFT_422036 [Russula compacta]|nr:hypothetical protein BJV74DRAFT_422036 [Russula compacta]